MSSDKVQELQARGIRAARQGNKEEARRLLQHALRLDPSNETAWLWLASVARNRRERVLMLQKVLELNPENDMALKAVQGMGIDPERLLPQRQRIDDTLADEGEAESEQVGIPLPDSAEVREALEQANQVIAPYQEARPVGEADWVRKSKARAGENEITVLRLQIGGVLALLGAIVIGLGLYGVSNNPQAQLLLFGASETPRPDTPTPTPTLTPRPDINPTATPTIDPDEAASFTLTPTPNPNDSYPLDVNGTPVRATPTPTELYRGRENNAIATAVAALEGEQAVDDAINLMVSRQGQTTGSFAPEPYYYEARLLLRQGEPEAALEPLEDAQERLDDVAGADAIAREDARLFQPLINAGYMQVYRYQIERALEVGRTGEANQLINDMETLAEEATDIAPNYVEPYVLLAEAYMLAGRYEEVIDLVDTAQEETGSLTSEVRLIVKRGRAHLERAQQLQRQDAFSAAEEQFAEAKYDGFYGVYVNPYSEAAHQLRVDAALAAGEPALAAAYTSLYLSYYPDSIAAFTRLANVRIAEDKPLLALESYTQALQQEGSEAARADAHLARAELYMASNRYQEAQADYTAALALRDTLPIRFDRMRAAYFAGDLTTAIDDADTLLDAGYRDTTIIRYVRGRAIVDQNRQAQYEQALRDLRTAEPGLSGEDRAAALFYQARILNNQDNPQAALNALNESISLVQNGSRRYLRGQVYEALDRREDAIEDYAWVVSWDTIYNYEFADTAAARLNALQEAITEENAQATATAASATQAVLDTVATANAERTATALALTQEAIGTFTPTPQATSEATSEVTAEATPDVTSAPTPTQED